MGLVSWEPFEVIEHNSISDQRSARRELRSHPAYPTSAHGVWVPPVDILESKDSYLVRAELPGMKRESFTWKLKTAH